MLVNYNPVVTKNELIDFLYELNIKNTDQTKNKEEISKEYINNCINAVVELEKQNNKLYCFKDVIGTDFITKNISNNLKTSYFIMIEENKYVYFYLDYALNFPKMEKNFIEQIDYILNHNLNKGVMQKQLMYLKHEYIEMINGVEQHEKPLDKKLKEYDFIKVISSNKKYQDISRKDIDECRWFLKYSDKLNLNNDEHILARLIILFGIVNMYFNNSDYYKEYPVMDSINVETDNEGYYKERITSRINEFIEEIDEYILFIRNNMDKIKDEDKYDFKCEERINIFRFLHSNFKSNRIFDFYRRIKYIDITKCVTESFNDLVAILRYINFEYYVLNGEFNKSKEIFEMDLPLFNYYKEFSKNENSKGVAEAMVYWIIVDMEIEESPNVSLDYFSKNNINPRTKRNIKVMLKFYMSCYYYFIHLNEENNASQVYEFLLYFKDGYNVEDFLLKCRYIKMMKVLNNDDKIIDISDIEKVDLAIDKLNERINAMNLVNQFDIEDVEDIYSNIEFKNFKSDNRNKVKKYIATGDKIMNTFSTNNNIDFDFSCAVIEWSKAVEIEIYEKLFEIIEYNDKCEIEKNFKKTYKEKEKNFRLKAYKDITVGIFNDMDNYSNGDVKLTKYLFDKYYSKYYNLDENLYNKLREYLKNITEPRNDSAHKGTIIDKESADKCKNQILSSKKALEILSKLQKRIEY